MSRMRGPPAACEALAGCGSPGHRPGEPQRALDVAAKLSVVDRIRVRVRIPVVVEPFRIIVYGLNFGEISPGMMQRAGCVDTSNPADEIAEPLVIAKLPRIFHT